MLFGLFEGKVSIETIRPSTHLTIWSNNRRISVLLENCRTRFRWSNRDRSSNGCVQLRWVHGFFFWLGEHSDIAHDGSTIFQLYMFFKWLSPTNGNVWNYKQNWAGTRSFRLECCCNKSQISKNRYTCITIMPFWKIIRLILSQNIFK